MAQLMQIRLQRYDAQPWGFRLQGGKDFAAPLVVQKINAGSLAEQAGLQPGDAVIKINDIDVFHLRHKEAQDLVVRSGNNFVVTVQRGGHIWRPTVTPTGQLPSPNPHTHHISTVTKTSLAHKPQEVHHIGGGYNNSARPFSSVNGNDGQVKSIVNKQYNTPVGIYSDETIAETLSAQAEVLAGGVLGINFKKNERQYQADKSEVLKFLHEEETGEHQEPEPRSPASFYWTHSHAIGGQRALSPVTPSKPQDERIGTSLQQNTLAPGAAHRPSLPTQLSEAQNNAALQSDDYKAELDAAAAAASVAPSERTPSTTLPQCGTCGVGIVGVFVRIKDKNLHVECFKCATCGTSLKNQGYYNFNNKLYCDIHARLAALQNPPSGTDGYVPVPIKPNSKLTASTISAALNSCAYNGNIANGSSTPSYSAPPSSAQVESIVNYDLPLPPPPSPTQLQQFQIQDTFANNTTINNHSRTNSSLSSSSSSLSPYSSTNGINNNQSNPLCAIAGNIENSLKNHNGFNYNNTNSESNSSTSSTLSLDRFISSSASPPGHSRQQSNTSSTESASSIGTDLQLPPPPPLLPPLSFQQKQYSHTPTIQQQSSMTINQSGKQNENDMNSNNRFPAPSIASGNISMNSNNGLGLQTNVYNKFLKEYSDYSNKKLNNPSKINTEHPTGTTTTTSPPSSLSADGLQIFHNPQSAGSTSDTALQGTINGKAEDPMSGDSRIGEDKEQFQYVTVHGNVIRSVIPPGKGVSVNYKVNQGFARPYGTPSAAPKSPTSYPPPSQSVNWVQHKPQPTNNPYATLPRTNIAGSQDGEQCQCYEYEMQHDRELRAASYFEEDIEICEANRESRNSFNWPPPKDESHDKPTAAPLYIAPPETQHVVSKPIQQKNVEQDHQETYVEQEQQQLHWQSRSAPELTGYSGIHGPEIESSSDSYTSTCTTTTTTSEEYQRMYAAQVQAYQMQAYEQSGSELDYHMDMEVAAMQHQGDHYCLSSNEYITGRRSAQECVESLSGTLNTYRLVDMVREVTPSPVPPSGTSRGPRRVEFVDEPQVEIIPKPDTHKATEQKENTNYTTIQQEINESVEEPQIKKEIYHVCGETDTDKLIIEDRTQILENQRIFQPTPEIKIDIPPVKPIPPTNIPNPIPKEWISPMVRALTTAPETPVHMVECPNPVCCGNPPQCESSACEKEKEDQKLQREPTPPKLATPEAEVLQENPPKGSLITSVLTTVPDYSLQFAPNPNDPIGLPEETEPYLPPPIDMKPYEREDRRPKSPFLKALTTAPDTPYNPFGHDVCSQLLDLPTPTEKLSMIDALITAPDRPYTPLNPEKATHIIEEQKKNEQKKPYQFQILTDDDICSTEMTTSSTAIESKIEEWRDSHHLTSAFTNMTNLPSVQPFKPSCEPLPPTTPCNSIVPLQQQCAVDAECELMRRAGQRNTYSKLTSASSTASQSIQTQSKTIQSSTTSLTQSKVESHSNSHEVNEFEDTKVVFPPPPPLSHLKPHPSQSGLHKPDTIPQYQRNWTVLPTQRPVRTPEPPELRENVPLAFVDIPTSPKPTVCSSAQQQQQQLSKNAQHFSETQQSKSVTTTAAASHTSICKASGETIRQQQRQDQQLHQQHKPCPTVPIIVEDRSGPVTMAFQSLDEHQQRDESYPPPRPYTPSQTNKPAPVIPFYQTPEKLCFEECAPTTGHLFDRRSVSPCPDRAKSPAPGPPPNPLSAIRAPRLRDADLPQQTSRNLQVGSITTGQSYLGAQQLQQQQQQGQLLSHYQTMNQTGCQSFVDKPEVVQQRQVGDLTIEKREKESHLAEEKKSQLESKTTSQVGNAQIERRRKVVEEYEHTQSAKTIEIRTGSASVTTRDATSDSERRSSYGKTGFVSNQARRLSGLEQEITNLTTQSQAISARAAKLSETSFPQLHPSDTSTKFPTKPHLPPRDEPHPAKYIDSPTSGKKVVHPPPGFQQQQSSAYSQSSNSQQQQSFSAQSSSTLNAATESSCSLTNASAKSSLTNQQQKLTSVIPVPAYKPSGIPTATKSRDNRCPMTGNVCPGAGDGAGSGACTAPCSQMQSQPNSNNNTYKPTASTGPAGFKPPLAQAQPQQPQQQNIGVTNTAPSVTNANDLQTSPSTGSGPSNVGRGGAFGATSAPKRGRGIINKAVGPGVRVPLCSSCSMQIRGPFITALGRIWCPDHFMCVNANCRRPLQDIGFVEEKGDLYCEFCFEKYLAPTCSKCIGKIKGDCLNAIGKHFHPECFTCAHCGKLFGNTPFFLEEGLAYCEADWNELFTTKCFACGFPVEAGDRWVEALNHNYHSQCFNCTFCKKNLEGQSFYNKGGRPFCKNHAR